MRAWLVAGLLIVACSGGRRDDKPMVFLEYEVAPEGRDAAIHVIRERLDSRGAREPVVMAHGDSRISVQLQGDPDELARTIEIIERSAALGVHPIVEDDPTMQAIYDAAMQEKPAGIFPMVDSWVAPAANILHHRSLYLWSADFQTLDSWLHARPPEQQVGGGRRLVLEQEDDSSAKGKSRWRTHVIDLAAVVTGKDVATASMSRDQIMGYPQVDVVLTAAGAARFGDATAAMIGRKLAIVLDSKVMSAPIIQTPIRGGRLVITIGGGDPKQQERDASDLVEVLKSGSMPAIRRISERHVGPAR